MTTTPKQPVDTERRGTTTSTPAAHPRVLLLTADTGGGHRASAEALREALSHDEPTTSVVLDPTNVPAAPRLVRRFGSLYGRLVRSAPWAWGVLFHATNGRRRCHALSLLMTHLLRRQLLDALAHHRPHVVVVLHPLLVAPAVAARNQYGTGEVVTVVTDLGNPHRSWWHRDVDHVIVPRAGTFPAVQGTKDTCRPREHAFGLPVRRQFARPCTPADRARARSRLGLAPDRFVVMVGGGGDGAHGTYAWASALASGPVDVDVIVMCGRNQRLRTRLSRLGTRPGRRLLVTGFVDDVATWMHAADLMVTKAGPGIIAEAAALGLPLLLAGHLPGQEAGNGAEVVRAGAGLTVTSTRDLLAKVAELHHHPDLIRRLRAGARRSGDPSAAARAAALITSIATED